MRGNKTDWEREASDSGLDSIRKNNAPVGGVFGYGDTGGQGGAFNRGGFREFGEVGRPITLPNGQTIEYGAINIPILNGIFGGKDGKKKDEWTPDFDPLNPFNAGATTPYPSPLANSPDARKIWPLFPGYMTDSPDTIDFYDTKMGRGPTGQWTREHWDEVKDVGGAIRGFMMGGPAGAGWSIANSVARRVGDTPWGQSLPPTVQMLLRNAPRLANIATSPTASMIARR